MDRNEADMLARALMDEYDQRERDSKLVPDERDILRRSRTELRRNNEKFKDDYEKLNESNPECANRLLSLSGIFIILWIAFIILLFMNMKFLILVDAFIQICIILNVRKKDVNSVKEDKIKYKLSDDIYNKQVSDSKFLWNSFIFIIILITLFSELLLIFLD